MNLHNKIVLLNDLFSLAFSKMIPSEYHLYIPYLVRILLLFFNKNQILNPENIKLKSKNKKNYETLQNKINLNEDNNKEDNQEKHNSDSKENSESTFYIFFIIIYI